VIARTRIARALSGVLAAAVLAAVALAGCGSPGAGAGPGGTGTAPAASGPGAPVPAPAPTRYTGPVRDTLHYASNTGTGRAAAARLGFNLFDLNPDKAAIDALGPGQRALVWVGNLDNTSCTPGFSDSAFTAAVDRLAGDPKVWGYYLSDEPHPRVCPDAVAHIRQRADYIRAHDPTHKSFIVVLDGPKECGTDLGCEYRVMRPESTHVDLIGIDPFPCTIPSGVCTVDRIDEQVLRAQAQGVPREVMVPVYQVFGQVCPGNKTHYYRLPSAQDLTGMLDRWRELVGTPVFDFAYTWRSEGPACPGLADADGRNGYADLQSVVRRHNANPAPSGGTSPSRG